MSRWRKWVGFMCVLSVVLGASWTAEAKPADVRPQGRAAAGVPGPRSAHIRQIPVAHPADLEGTLSGLVRDPEGFYWTHTDGGSATAEWTVRLVKVKVTPSGAQVTEVIPMRDENGNVLTGDVFDPEDVVVAPDGTLWMVDEIHPLIVQVSRDGQILRRVEAPSKYKARVKGRGFEGAAMSPDGRTLFVILQTGLSTEADKTHTWLLAYDVATGTFKEYSYHLDRPSDYQYPEGVSAWVGANGLAVSGANELLVLERDNLAGEKARVKRIYRVQIPAEPTDAPLTKELHVDLLALGYDLEKVEGLAAPNPNSILVINDNDGNADIPTVLWQVQF